MATTEINRRIIEMSNLATTDETLAITNGKMTYGALEYKLEKDGRLSHIETGNKFDDDLINDLSIIIYEIKEFDVARQVLEEVKDVFPRYNEYVKKIEDEQKIH